MEEVVSACVYKILKNKQQRRYETSRDHTTKNKINNQKPICATHTILLFSSLAHYRIHTKHMIDY